MVNTTPIKSEVYGNASGGAQWDDGPNHSGIRKVYVTVTSAHTHLRSMDIDYDKNGQVETIRHGMKNGETQEFSVDFPNEFITSVEGTYNNVHEGNYLVITSLTFKTSKGRSSQTFGSVTGTKFVFESPGSVITGFHGSCGGSFDSLGVYFSPPAPIKSELQGNADGGAHWDDGPNYNGIRKVYVTITYEHTHLRSMDIDYDKKGQVETIRHGMKNGETQEFSVDFPNEYITSVEGTYNNVHEGNYVAITSLTFKTSKGRTETFGLVTGTKFVFERPGSVIIGFHGSCGGSFDSFGVYFSPILPAPLKPAKKLDAIGGNGGASWDDGAFDGVQKIFVGQGNDGVSFLMFEYNKGSQVIIGDGRGKKTVLGTETFELDYPSEYITSVEGYYDKVYGVEAEVMTSLTFKTNKRTSPPFGMTAGEHFEFKDEGNKIVGFHGKAGDYVHQIGVYVAPITTN